MYCLFPDRDSDLLNCDEECYGIATLDDCGICAGEGVHQDCGCGTLGEFGIPEGDCDCDGNVDLDCGCGAAGPSGCDNACGSTLVNDECGVCNGPGTIYACGCTELLDCGCNQSDDSDRLVCDAPDCPGGGIGLGDDDDDGICDDVDECVGAYDECAICDGPGAVYECGCADIPEGDCDCVENVNDECGVCNGPGTIYACGCTELLDCGCNQSDDSDRLVCDAPDCPGGGIGLGDDDDDGICDDVDECVGAYDECAICDGPGAVYECGCADIPEGDCDCVENVNDECGVCDGNGCHVQDCVTYPGSDYDCLGNTLSIFGGNIPKKYSLQKIYPNPFNPITNITYGLPENANVKIIIYDLSGKQVQSLVNGIQGPGYHSVDWNADNYSSGMYLVRMYTNESTFGEYVSTQKILLIK